VVKTFHPRDAIFRKFYRDCNPLPFEGTTEGKLVKALRRNGVRVSVRSDLNYAGIRAAIEAGFPVVATVAYEDSYADHWIVIYGVGWRPRRVFLCNQVLQGWPGFSREELGGLPFPLEPSRKRAGLLGQAACPLTSPRSNSGITGHAPLISIIRAHGVTPTCAPGIHI
jgi:hypothetical protein